MTREELKEKAALEAYPENVSYSTLVEKNVDYNGRDRVIYKQGYDKGFDDAIEKTCEWLKCNFNMPDDFEFHLKKAMEEQQ